MTVVDVETAKGNRNSICQIGIVIIENGKIKETFSSLIQPPENDYLFRNIQIHGIDSGTTKNSPLFPEVWEEIKHWFVDTKVVAHNVAFDSDCLFQTLVHYNLEVPSYVEDCTYTRTNLKLADLVLTLDVKLENHHDALVDALACAQCYIKLELGVEPNLSLINKKLETDRALHDNTIEVLAHESDHHLGGKKFLFTGVMHILKREEAEGMVKKLGGKVVSTITKGIDYVVMGESPGPKKTRDINELKSKGYNIKVISEETFLEIIK